MISDQAAENSAFPSVINYIFKYIKGKLFKIVIIHNITVFTN